VSEGFAARAGDISTPASSIEEIKAAGLKSLEPLLASDVARKAVAETQERQGSAFTEESVVFWPGNAAFLEISTDDLRKLPGIVPGIEGIYPNRRIPPPTFIEVKNVPSAVTAGVVNAWGLQKINSLATWGAHGARGRGVTVGMLDSGVDFTHADLNGKLKTGGWAEFDDEGIEVPGSQPHDSAQHGTMCAGTIVGGNHSGGWIGVAPEAELAVALVIKGKGGTEKQALGGLTWMLNQKVDVINMSIGKFIADPETPPVFAKAIYNCMRAGIPTVVAIGNEGEQTSDSPGNDLFAFSVGATDIHDSPAGFSGGRTQVLRETDIPSYPQETLPFIYKKPEISAPGVAVKTSLPGNKWGFINGTSLATAHVSGAIALLLSATTIREKTQGHVRTFIIQDLLTGAVEELGESGQDHRYGLGRLDVLRAIGFAYEAGFKPTT
jgi:subtilisin family serine protease